MNILLFTLEYPPFIGGVANYYENLVKNYPSFAKSTEDKLENSEIFVLDNKDNKLLNSKIWPKWRSGYKELKKEIKNKKIDYILVGHILPLGTIAYLNFKKTGLPYSVILHGMDFTYAIANKRKANLTKKILENSQNIICGNSYVAGLVKEFGVNLKNKIYVVNPGIEAELATRSLKAFSDRVAGAKDKIILFSLGRLVKRKGFDKVIEVIPDVLKEIPNLEYIIAGTGPDEEYLKEKAKDKFVILEGEKRPIESFVKFIGEVDEEKKWKRLNKCDIFIMPSRIIQPHPNPLLRKERENKQFPPLTKGEVRRGFLNKSPFEGGLRGMLDFEGFGIVYLEANLAGKPVIAGRSGGVADAVEDSVNGLLVDPENTNDIKNAIIKLAKDKSLREKLGQQGKERAIKDFNWQNQAEKIYQIISK